MALEDSPEVEAFLDAWYETEINPQSEVAWERFDLAADKLADNTEEQLTFRPTIGLLKKVLGGKYNRWLRDNNLPRSRD